MDETACFIWDLIFWVNACLNVVEKRIDIAGCMVYEWMFRTVVNVFGISLIVLLWNKFKKKATEYCKI